MIIKPLLIFSFQLFTLFSFSSDFCRTSSIKSFCFNRKSIRRIFERELKFFDIIFRSSVRMYTEFTGGFYFDFCRMSIVELMKKAQKEGKFPHRYFWRTYQGQEIDFLEEIDGQIFAYEFKYNANKQAKLPKAFQDTYSVARYSVIHKQNCLEYLL